ncbi:MAG: response regulator [bacterium]|nr:response regulator [bacterium]MDY4099256.1 response regulator [Lachnospiraceae bacterium]
MKSRYADKTILVVDDDAMNLKVARFVLEQKGYNVMTVSSGAECILQLKQKRVDLILLDVEMPVMNGMKTLEHIRETREYRKIPVMFLTADASKDTVISAGKLDVAGYVKKPYDPQELLERIKKIFNEDL